MNDDTSITSSDSRSFWSKIPIWIRAIAIGLLVNILAVGLWPALALQLPIPVAFVIMTIFLGLYVKYLSGSWRPKSTSAVRRENFRALNLPGKVWFWGGCGALLLWANKTAFGEFIFRLFPFPPDAYAATLDYFNGLSSLDSVLAIVMTSVVAGIAEETGLRGYMQKPLEKKYGPFVAITIVSLAFTLIHIPQVTNLPYLSVLFTFSIFFGVLAYATNSLLPGIIIHAIMDTHAFMYLTGYFGETSGIRATIFEVGMDSHFWWTSLTLVVTAVLFVLAIRKLYALKKSNL